MKKQKNIFTAFMPYIGFMLFLVGICLCNLYIIGYKSTAENTDPLEYVQEKFCVQIDDLCEKEEGSVKRNRDGYSADIRLTLKEDGAEKVRKRFAEAGYNSEIPAEFEIPEGLAEHHRYASECRNEKLLAYYGHFDSVYVFFTVYPVGEKHSEETMLLLTRAEDGTEHLYCFR